MAASILPSVQLYLVRHAEAADGEPDELRPLTPEGRRAARELGERLAADGIRLDAVLTSPLLRARETGAELARPAGLEPEADERLAPGATAEDVRAAAEGRGEAGEVTVLGTDPALAGGDWRERIGVVLQSSAMYETLTVAESLSLFAGYYASPRPVDEVVELVGLNEKRNDRVRRLSGGQRRRLDLGLALVGDPELIFLDEPTTGFDPHARRQAWETLRSLRRLGKTILLTTHYLDEAERLADRVAVLRQGEIVAAGPPAAS